MSEIFNGTTNTGHRLQFEATGDILSTGADGIKQEVAKKLAEGGAAAISVFDLNLRRTRMIDSVGLNLLVWLIKQVRARGGQLRISGADANVLRTLQFTRLDREVEIAHLGR